MLATAVPPSLDGVSDEALAAAVRRGDDRAFEVLPRRYHRRVGAYVAGFVRDHGRAEDVTQEVFVSALRRMRATGRPIHLGPVDLRDRQERLHRRLPPHAAGREVSYDAEDGLAPRDLGRLIGSDPSPQEAVVVKQQLPGSGRDGAGSAGGERAGSTTPGAAPARRRSVRVHAWGRRCKGRAAPPAGGAGRRRPPALIQRARQVTPARLPGE